MLSATVYLKYFSKQYDERVIDNWIKNYFTLIKENDNEFRTNKKLRKEIK